MTFATSVKLNRKNIEQTMTESLDYCWNALFATILFIILTPVSILIYFKLKQNGTKAPIFKQTRIGKDGKEFEIYKFRTMVMDANKDGPFICKSYEDKRITPFGLYLRRRKLDEIPQLINIIKGEMSFVGPRPEIPHFHKINSSIPRWEERISVKPGITGLAQIDRYVSHNPNEKIVLDLKYIENKSFIYDWHLMLKTAYLWIAGKTL